MVELAISVASKLGSDRTPSNLYLLFMAWAYLWDVLALNTKYSCKKKIFSTFPGMVTQVNGKGTYSSRLKALSWVY